MALGCGVALRVRRGLGCGVAQGCEVAQTVARRHVIRKARVRISARRHRGDPLSSGSNEEIKSGARRIKYI